MLSFFAFFKVVNNSFQGVIDILVNNAGISYRGEALYTSTDVDVKLMMTNYHGTAALTKGINSTIQKHLITKGTRIKNSYARYLIE